MARKAGDQIRVRFLGTDTSAVWKGDGKCNGSPLFGDVDLIATRQGDRFERDGDESAALDLESAEADDATHRAAQAPVVKS